MTVTSSKQLSDGNHRRGEKLAGLDPVAMFPHAGGAVALDSVNVGQPADLAWRGRLVRTAIDKRPVNGRAGVSRLNVAGDGRADLAGHGGEHRAVFVYQRDSYRYWHEQLRRDLARPGTFGESVTVTDLGRDLREGTVGAGDTINRVARAAGALTVRQTSDLLYGSQHERDLLRRSIDTPALSDGWRDSLSALLAAGEERATPA